MKKTIFSLLLITFLSLSTNSFAKNSTIKNHSIQTYGCNDWMPIPGTNGSLIGVWRECTNIFGRTRIEIVSFY